MLNRLDCFLDGPRGIASLRYKKSLCWPTFVLARSGDCQESIGGGNDWAALIPVCGVSLTDAELKLELFSRASSVGVSRDGAGVDAALRFILDMNGVDGPVEAVVVSKDPLTTVPLLGKGVEFSLLTPPSSSVVSATGLDPSACVNDICLRILEPASFPAIVVAESKDGVLY